MKKVVIILSLAGIVISAGCRSNKRDDERRRLEMERVRQDQENARLADEQRILELQMRARQDSASCAKPQRTGHRNFYVVIGSFRVAGNAYAYSSSMQQTLGNVSVVARRGWHYVTVGGAFWSRAAAVRKMREILSSTSTSFTASAPAYSEEEEYSEEETEEEEYSDEEGDEEYADDEEYGDEESEDEEEYSEEEEVVADEMPAPAASGFSGQAWVMVL